MIASYAPYQSQVFSSTGQVFVACVAIGILLLAILLRWIIKTS